MVMLLSVHPFCFGSRQRAGVVIVPFFARGALRAAGTSVA